MDVREKLPNEKRLIDANVVLAKKFTTGLSDASGNYYGNADVVFADDIEAAPTVDAVEVVRCRECVGRPFWEEDHNGVPVCLLSGLYVRSEDDFCSYGERKEGTD